MCTPGAHPSYYQGTGTSIDPHLPENCSSSDLLLLLPAHSCPQVALSTLSSRIMPARDPGKILSGVLLLRCCPSFLLLGHLLQAAASSLGAAASSLIQAEKKSFQTSIRLTGSCHGMNSGRVSIIITPLALHLLRHTSPDYEHRRLSFRLSLY